MDGNRKWKFAVLAGLQALAAAAAAGAILFLLYRYAVYGERSARESWTSPSAEKMRETGGDGTAGEQETGEQGTGAQETGEQEAGVHEAEVQETGEQGAGVQRAALPASVRVQILRDGFSGEYHENLEFTCETEFTVARINGWTRTMKEFSVSEDSLEEGECLWLRQEAGRPITVASLSRADGCPQYEGELWIYRETEGIVLVNEVSLEEYLCGVVSSEMPSDYPPEAQKAQAVCARTYACIRIRGAEGGDSLADLDDSVNDQVYNNYRATESSVRAVRATRGEILPLEEIQYYSTSCQSEHREDLGSDRAFRKFLSQEPEEGAEYDSPWLRWEAEIPAEDILETLTSQYDWQAGHIDSVRVAKRSGDGRAQELEVRCGERTKTVSGEYYIRQLLSPEHAQLRLRDGSEHSGMKLLPSAWFWLEPEQEGSEIRALRIHGGGYGHGNGMSQCGAAALAREGLDYREILEYYYQ